MSTISLCMIVKNEENHIRKCLQSAISLIDEAIIVDTGSTDSTMDIIKMFKDDFPDKNINLIETIWENDFAKARNLSMKDATSDWILILDADEMIECNPVVLKKILNSMDEKMWTIPIINYSDEGAPAISTVMHRLFKNEQPKYTGAIHERLILNGIARGGDILPENLVRIHHVGYTKEVIKEKNKAKRNLKIILKQIQEQPDVSFHRYNLGKTYMQQQKYDKALDAFVKWSNCTNSDYYEEMDTAYSVAICLIKLKKYKDAHDYLNKLKNNETFTNQAKLYNIWAELFEKEKNYKKVLYMNHRALVCGLIGSDISGVQDVGIGSYYTILLIAIVLEETTDDRAIYYFINGLFHEENKYLWGKQQFINFAKTAENGKYIDYVEKFEKVIADVLKGDELIVDENDTNTELITNESSIIKSITEAIELDKLTEAKAIIDECENILGNYPALYNIKGVLAMMEHDNIMAMLYFSLANRYFPNQFDSIYNLAFLFESIGIDEIAAIYYYQVSRHGDCPLAELEDMHNKVDEYKQRFSWFEID